MDQYTMANVQKLMALVAAKEIDVIMADTKTFTNYADPGYFSNLNEVLPKELVDKYQDRFFYYDVPDDEQGKSPSASSLPMRRELSGHRHMPLPMTRCSESLSIRSMLIMR